MRALFKAVQDEFNTVLKTPWLLITGVIVPVFWSVILACIFSAGLMRDLPVGLVDNDNSAASRQTAQVLESIPSVDVVRFESAASAREALASSQIYGLAVIPQDWSAKSSGARSDSAIELYLNRSYYAIAVTLEADIKMAFADSAVQKLIAAAAQTGGGLHGAKTRFSVVTPDVLIAGNPTINYQAYLLATLIPGVLALGCILTCVGVLTREWRTRKVRALLAGDTPLGTVLAGRLLFWVTLYSVYALGYVAWFAGWEGWAPQGSLLIWCVGAVLLMTAMGACAFMYTSMAPSWIIAMSAAICYIAPTFPFTGFSYPIDSMDQYAQAFCQIFPLTWFLRVQSSQWVLASDLSHSLYLLSIMGLFTLIPLVLGSLFFRFNFKRKAKREADFFAHPHAELPVPQGFWALAGSIIKRGIINHDTFIIFVGATAFYLVFYAWPYSNQQLTHIPTAVVDLDNSSASRNVVTRLTSLTMVHVAQVTHDAAQGQALYKNEKVDAVITIPEGFEADVLAGKPTSLRLTANGAYPVKARAAMASFMAVANEVNMASVGVNLMRAGADVSQLKTLTHKPVALTDQSLYNTLAGYAAYIVPLVMPVIVQAVLLMCIGLTLGGWLSQAQAPEILKTILGSVKGFAAFFTCFWLFGLMWMLYAMGPDFVLFDYTSLKNPSGTLIVALLFVSAVVWMGLSATLLMNSHAYVAQCLVLISAPCVFLTGAVFPPFDFLLPARIVADLLPTTPGCIAMVNAAQNGASTTSIMPLIVHLLVLNGLYATTSILLARMRARQRGLELR